MINKSYKKIGKNGIPLYHFSKFIVFVDDSTCKASHVSLETRVLQLSVSSDMDTFK